MDSTKGNNIFNSKQLQATLPFLPTRHHWANRQTNEVEEEEKNR